MATATETGKGPGERPSWGPQMRKFFTPMAQQALEQALAIYAPYTSDQLDEDPALKLTIAKTAAPNIERVVQGMIQAVMQNFSRKGILKEDFLEIIPALDKALVQKYPEHEMTGERFSEAFIFNEIRQRLMAYLLTTIALREREHRNLQGKPTRGVMGWRQVEIAHPVHETFFALLDRPGAVLARIQEAMGAATAYKIGETLTNYILLRDILMPFLRGKVAPFKNPGNKSREQLARENDRVVGILLREADKEIPMCVIEDNDTLLSQEDPLTMQFTPIDDPEFGFFHTFWAQIDYLEKAAGEIVAGDAEVQRLLRPTVARMDGIGQRTMVPNLGKIPAFFADRFDGELGGATFGPETMKLISGQTPNYELLRRDVLWYLAQISCRRPILQDMFGATFAPRVKSTVGPKPPQQPGDSSNPTGSNPSTDAERHYPGGEGSVVTPQARAEALFGALEEGTTLDIAPADNGEGIIPPEDVEEVVDATVERVQRESEVVGYRKLLPLIRKIVKHDDGSQEVKIVAMKPSKKALDNAAAAGKELRRGIEFPELGQIFRPHEVPALLEKFEVTNLEDLVAKYPDRAHIRYEGWVSPYKRGQAVHGVIESVRASVHHS